MKEGRSACFKRGGGPVWTVVLLLRDYMDNRDLSPLPQLNCRSMEESFTWNVGGGQIGVFYGSFLVCSLIIISCLEDVKSDTSEKIKQVVSCCVPESKSSSALLSVLHIISSNISLSF